MSLIWRGSHDLPPLTRLLTASFCNQALVKQGCIIKCFLSQEGWGSCASKPQWEEGRVTFLAFWRGVSDSELIWDFISEPDIYNQAAVGRKAALDGWNVNGKRLHLPFEVSPGEVWEWSRRGGAGARTCIHLLLHPPVSLDCQACFLCQAQEDFHWLQTKSQVRLADP